MQMSKDKELMLSKRVADEAEAIGREISRAVTCDEGTQRALARSHPEVAAALLPYEPLGRTSYVLSVLDANPDAIGTFSEEIRDDSIFMRAAVVGNPDTIRWTGPVLRRNRGALYELVMIAVQRDGLALHLFPKFRFDKQLALVAVRQNWTAIEAAANELLADHDIMIAALCGGGRTACAHPDLKAPLNQLLDDVDFVRRALEDISDGDATEWIGERIPHGMRRFTS